MTPERADRVQAILWIAVGLAIVALMVVLGPILSPFLLAAIVGYVCAPLVDRLERWRVPRLLGVLIAMLLLLGVGAAFILIIVPMLQEEIQQFGSRIPEALRALNQRFVPWVARSFGLHLHFDVATLTQSLTDHRDLTQVIVGKLFNSLRIGGTVIFGIVANLLLTPIVLFYLLLDWHAMLARLEGAIPRPWHARMMSMVREIDLVLAEFLRGQVLVMLLLAAYYTLALWIAGMPFALPLGLITGLFVFIPYLGYATGLTLAILVALVQFAGFTPLLIVLIVYGIGQVLESFVLTPWLVGNRIGLHPLAVIFALLAFGQLFGFFGVLLALPASAALLVGLREVRKAYLASRFYRGGPLEKQE